MYTKITIFIILTVSYLALAKEDKIIAKINDKAIHESQIKDRLLSYSKITGQDLNYDTIEQEVKTSIISNMLLGDLILEKAKASNIEQSADYKDALKITQEQLIQKLYLEKLAKEHIDEKSLKDKYNQIISQTNEEYDASHILVASEKEALSIKSKLEKGEDFSKLASEHSLDKHNDGNLGYFTLGQMVPEFEQALISLKIGEISQPVKTEFGYHLIKLKDKRKATIETFAQMRPKLVEDMTAQFIQDYVTKLKTDNKIEIINDK